MKNFILSHQKVGFIGAGSLAQALITGLLREKKLNPDQIVVSNRTQGKVQKLQEQFKIISETSNEAVIEKCEIVLLCVKPQDLLQALEPLGPLFDKDQIVISLAAGIPLNVLEKYLPQCRLARVIPNTPAIIGQGVSGYLLNNDEDDYVADVVEDLFTCLGSVLKTNDEDQLTALMIACSCGTGFVFELMMYWQDWLEEHGFEKELARKMTEKVFAGAALMSQQSLSTLENLQTQVASKKGVTEAGLQSMREYEIERSLRISFEKADLRNQEISKKAEQNRS
ncbi:MAG: pyrroline-5-carboxylate reductase family protein [Pseudobdellovibrionaceae bacterium]